jgi:hypothetical protein
MNLCIACGQDFGSLGAFDAHRVGSHAYTYSAYHRDGRRCLPPEELRARNWTRDRHGRWRRPSDGAPWALSQDQVTAQRRSQVPVRAERHPRRTRPSTRSPESQTEAAA